MKVFVCTSFTGHWPVGTSAVVVAESAEVAAKALQKQLALIGLAQEIEAADMEEIKTREHCVRILQDGDY
jgi:hypothetical protein